MSASAFQVQVRTVPVGGVCQVRRPGDTANREVWLTREALPARVNEWLLVVESSGVWWGVALFGAAGAPTPPPMPDSENPAPEGSGPQKIVIPPQWVGYRIWTHHPSDPTKAPYSFEHRADGLPAGLVGRTQGASDVVPNPNPLRSAEAMGCYLGAEGLAVTGMVAEFMTWWSNPPATGVKATLWRLPVVRPADQFGHPGSVVRLSTAAILADIGPSQWMRYVVPESWVAQLVSGEANGLGVTYPDDSPPMTVWPSVTLSGLEVTYEV